jgi:hypothetical protein
MGGNGVAVAFEHAEIACKVYNDYVNYVLSNKDDINWTELDRLAKIANDADRELEVARHKEINCLHQHVSMMGNHYYVDGDVWDDIQEVCQDCGKVVG